MRRMTVRHTAHLFFDLELWQSSIYKLVNKVYNTDNKARVCSG